MNLFHRNSPDVVPVDTPDDVAPDHIAIEQARRTGAYEQGRSDARGDVNERALAHDREIAVRQAYDRGRRDERARHPRHHGSPMFALIGVLAVATVGFVIYLGVHEGSFARGGQVVDQHISGAAQSTQQATHDVAARAGDALQTAGSKLKQTAPPSS